jgi:hypothetical protein
MSKRIDPDHFEDDLDYLEDDIDKELYEASQELRDEIYQRKPVNVLLLEPQEPPRMIEAFDTDECWSSLIGPDWRLHDLYDGIAVIIHDDSTSELLQPNVRLYLPRERKEIIVYGSLIATGRCYYDLEAPIPYEGPWICSITEFGIQKLSDYVRDLKQ